MSALGKSRFLLPVLGLTAGFAARIAAAFGAARLLLFGFDLVVIAVFVCVCDRVS
jgi:hypothetical protein